MVDAKGQGWHRGTGTGDTAAITATGDTAAPGTSRPPRQEQGPGSRAPGKKLTEVGDLKAMVISCRIAKTV
jgi:hypothetical protein